MGGPGGLGGRGGVGVGLGHVVGGLGVETGQVPVGEHVVDRDGDLFWIRDGRHVRQVRQNDDPERTAALKRLPRHGHEGLPAADERDIILEDQDDDVALKISQGVLLDLPVEDELRLAAEEGLHDVEATSVATHELALEKVEDPLVHRHDAPVVFGQALEPLHGRGAHVLFNVAVLVLVLLEGEARLDDELLDAPLDAGVREHGPQRDGAGRAAGGRVGLDLDDLPDSGLHAGVRTSTLHLLERTMKVVLDGDEQVSADAHEVGVAHVARRVGPRSREFNTTSLVFVQMHLRYPWVCCLPIPFKSAKNLHKKYRLMADLKGFH